MTGVVVFADKWGFGPQRLKASEVYDKVKWGEAKKGEDNE